MITNFVSKAAKYALLGAIAICSVQAATVTYTLNNYSLSGGDPIYSVASDVTFTNLTFTEIFSNAQVTAPLYDFNNVPQTSLSTTTLDLTSAPVSDSTALRGSLQQSTVTGSLSQTTLSILSSFGGTPSTVTVLPFFTAALPVSSSTVNVNVFDANGKAYAIGSLQSVTVGAAATPEPGTFAIAAVGILALLGVTRRLREVTL